jgi:uncharacterized membrane protein YoaK (UPF0700 family)
LRRFHLYSGIAGVTVCGSFALPTKELSVGRNRSSKASVVAPGEDAPALRLRGAARMRVFSAPGARQTTRRSTPPPTPRRRISQPPAAPRALGNVVALPRSHTEAVTPAADLPRSGQPDLFSASLLGAIAGGVDAAGWFCLAGLLPSHLTASLVMLGARVTEYDAAEVRARVAMLPVFVCTVALVKWSARWMTARRLPVLPVLLTVLTLGLGLFCVAGSLSDALLADDPRVLLMVGGLGVASMAVQNAIMRLCLAQLCPTTVMTGNLTQLVMAGVDLLAHREPEPEARARLINAGCPLLGFVLGSVSCGYLASRQGLICLLVPLALSLGTTVRAWRRWNRQRKAEGKPRLFDVLGMPQSV